MTPEKEMRYLEIQRRVKAQQIHFLLSRAEVLRELGRDAAAAQCEYDARDLGWVPKPDPPSFTFAR